MTRFVITLLLVYFTAGCGIQRENQFEARQVTVGGSTYNYRVYVPKNRPADAKLPVMLYLHGSNARGDDNLAQVQGLNQFIADNPERFNFIIVAPQCRRDAFWVGEMSYQALAALDETVKEFNGDDRRLYLTGYSLGGNGVWLMGALYPGKFAALIPIAGWAVPSPALTPHQRAPLTPELLALFDSADPYQAFAEKIGSMPVWAFHGARDTTVPINDTRQVIEALKSAGNKNANLTEYENDGHDIVAKPFSDPKLFEWLNETKATALDQSGSDGTARFTRMVEFRDQSSHKIEFTRTGIYIDGDLKHQFAEGYHSPTFLTETDSYWDQGESGHWFLFGMSLAMGICGMPTYGVANVKLDGSLRVSEESPGACIGDWPGHLEFEIRTREPLSKTEENLMPTWKISNALEFNGTTFTWKDVQKSKRKTVKK